MKVPWLDLQGQNAALRDEILPLWEEILGTSGFVGGPHVQGFEEEFAEACGAPHCRAVSNGTDALRLIFRALELDQGDEIITVPNTFIATAEAIVQAGGRPVFVDIDPRTYTMDAARINDAVTPRTKGIVPVHLYGQTACMDDILAAADEHGLWVVEDAAQAHLAEYRGRKAGSMGIAGAFSFYPGKNLGACGEAGAITTSSEDLAGKVGALRDHGQYAKYRHELEGYNNRCDALQAAALRVKLKHLPTWNERRRHLAGQYVEALRYVDGIVLPHVAAGCVPVWHLFVAQVAHRDAVQAALGERGVGTGLHYPVPLHLQGAFKRLGYSEGAFPVTEEYCKKLLTLPMFPDLTAEQVAYVCEQLLDVV